MNEPMLKIGDKVLVTTYDWFMAPDGSTYKAAFGTVKAVLDSQQTLGVKTNARSTNWYAVIGNITIAGCQINYAVKTERCNLGPAKSFATKDGVVNEYNVPSTIYNADQEYFG
jgi:hypothetical protein